MSEHDEQCAVVYWFKTVYPQYKSAIMAIPNGAHLAGDNKKRAMKMAYMKKEGFKKGVSDLFIAVPRGDSHGLWCELKDKGKTWCHVKPEQRQHLEDMRLMGYEAIWCSGFDVAKAAITTYMEQGM